MIYLKQSTASQEVLLGPFVDSTDGVTAETGLTIANTDIKIWVAGATTLASKNSGGATHISNGNYYAVFDATDTATLGSGAIVVQVSGALAVRHDICILAANVYDSLVGGGDLLDVSTTQWNGTAVGSTTVRADLINIAGAAVSTSTAQLGVNAVQAGGTAWGSGAITAGSIASNAITAAKIATDAIGSAQLASTAVTEIQTGLSTLDAAAVRSAVGLASANLDTQIATLATAANLATVAGYVDTEVAAILAAVDTEVAAIKAKTDSLTFTVAGQLDANVQSINDVTITGNGQVGTEFGV